MNFWIAGWIWNVGIGSNIWTGQWNHGFVFSFSKITCLIYWILKGISTVMFKFTPVFTDNLCSISNIIVTFIWQEQFWSINRTSRYPSIHPSIHPYIVFDFPLLYFIWINPYIFLTEIHPSIHSPFYVLPFSIWWSLLFNGKECNRIKQHKRNRIGSFPLV